MTTLPDNEEKDVPISEETWDENRALISNLYRDKDLAQVQQLLQKEKGFDASRSQYKRKFTAWGLSKNTSKKTMDIIVQELKSGGDNEYELSHRAADRDLVVRGRRVKLSQVKRHLRKQRNSLSGSQSPAKSASPARALRDTSDAQTPTTARTDTEVEAFRSPGMPLSLEDEASTASTPSRSEGPSKHNTHPRADIEVDDMRSFACPYHKKDPIRFSRNNVSENSFRTCAYVVLRTTSRLKQHLYRAHRRPEGGSVAGMTADDGFMTDSQIRLIKKRHVGVDDVETWYHIYKVLFPDEPPERWPRSPYNEIGNANAMSHFIALFQALDIDLARQISLLTGELPESTQSLVDRALEETFPHLPRRLSRTRANTDPVIKSTMTTATTSSYLDAVQLSHVPYSWPSTDVVPGGLEDEYPDDSLTSHVLPLNDWFDVSEGQDLMEYSLFENLGATGIDSVWDTRPAKPYGSSATGDDG